jgi:hypothetical protein
MGVLFRAHPFRERRQLLPIPGVVFLHDLGRERGTVPDSGREIGPPETIRLPFALKVRLTTPAEWPLRVKTFWPVAVSQSLIVRSKLAVASRRPSGLKTAQVASAVWPIRVWTTRPLPASRRRTELVA